MNDIASQARPTIPERLRDWLSRPRADQWVLLLIFGISLLSIDTGLGADDHIHQVIVNGARELPGFRRAPLDLFRFAPGDAATAEQMMHDGLLPWWADVQAKLAFWRPLTSATHWLDYTVWPRAEWLMHLESLLWYWLGILGIRALYRAVEIPWIATFALLLYGVDDARGAPIAWIANRHALISAAFAVWAVVLHVRYRERKWALAGVLAPLLLALGLLAGEGAVGMAAYLVAYALYRDPDRSVANRILSLAPYGVLIILWRIVHRTLGYGVFGSGLYVDPATEPLRFLAALAERSLPLLLSQLALPWSEWWMFYPIFSKVLQWIVGGLALVVIGAAVGLVVPLFKRDAMVRFWTVGALLAVVPLGTTFPSDRMLLFVGIGAFAVMAHAFDEALARRESLRATRPWRALPGFIIGVHLVIALLLYPMRARGVIAVRHALDLAEQSYPADPALRRQAVVIVNPPADPFAAYVPIMRAAFGKPLAKTQLWLATGATAVTLEGIDDYTVRVIPEGGFLSTTSERALRSPNRPFQTGSIIDVDLARIEITRTENGRPLETLVHFRIPLTDPALRWIRWKNMGYEPFVPPRPGQRIVLEKVDLLRITLGT